MDKKIHAMRCKNEGCNGVIVYLGEMSPGVFGLISDPDFEKRLKQVGNKLHIICPICKKTNILESAHENNLPVFKLIKILEEE